MDNRKIDYQYKLLYALGIIFVVAGHCKNGGFSFFYDWFPPYSFHLGLFMFCSGYFYNSQSEENIIFYFCKKAKRLLMPLFLWNIVYAFLVLFLSREGFTIGGGINCENLIIKPITNGHQFGYNLGGWFVIPLFMVEIANVGFRKLLSRLMIKTQFIECAVFIVYMLLGFLAVWFASNGYNNGWHLVIVRMLFFMPFFAAGSFYKTFLKNYELLSTKVVFIIIIMLQLGIISYLGKVPCYTPSWCNDFTDGVFIPYIIGFLGIAFWLQISSVLTPVIGKNKAINRIADNTYAIMIHQFIGFMFLKGVIALLSKYTLFFQDFDWHAFKSNIWYFYVPFKTNQFLVLYLLAGICIPIIINIIIDRFLKVAIIKLPKSYFTL